MNTQPVGPRPTRSTAGFTLVELVVVVVIIGVLATIAIPRFLDARERAFETRAVSDLRNLVTYQAIWWNDERGYAGSIEELDIQLSDGVALEITAADGSGWAAQAEQSFLPAMTCGIYYGSADPADGAPATSPGVVHCVR